jgi:hypothetical protein
MTDIALRRRGKGAIYDTEPLRDPGFTNDARTVETCALAYMHHGLLPERGGVLDQDATLMGDIFTWLAWYAQVDEGIGDADGPF